MSDGKVPVMPKVAMLRVADLQIDARYQRDLDERRAQRIAREYEPHRYGLLSVSWRGNGRHYVVDGQHRLRAAQILEFEIVPCAIYDDLGAQDEAQFFSRLQMDRKGLSAVDRFRAQVFANDVMAVEINEVVISLGMSIDRARHSGKSISAVISLERIYKRYGGDHLRTTLQVSREIWEGDNGSLQGAFLEGLARFLAKYGDHRFTDVVKDRLRTVSPMALMRRASAIRGGGSQMGHLIEAQLQTMARVKGPPRKFKKS